MQIFLFYIVRIKNMKHDNYVTMHESNKNKKVLKSTECNNIETRVTHCTMRLSMKIKETKILKSKNSFYAHF